MGYINFLYFVAIRYSSETDLITEIKPKFSRLKYNKFIQAIPELKLVISEINTITGLRVCGAVKAL